MTKLYLLTTAILLATVGFVAQAADHQQLQADVDSANAEFKKADSSLKDRFAEAEGYVVFPNVGKGGFIVGGAHGNGHVFERGKLIGYAALTQVTVGAQIGGQKFKFEPVAK